MNQYKKDFPIFLSPENDGIIYFDNAATTQRPKTVIDSISDYYKKDNANPLRGLLRAALLFHAAAREATAR